LQVIFSGHETPGEGEHKIMEYIRKARSQPAWDPNTKHCLYGLDADLIVLGLLSHEPHFSLLREEVKFGRQSRVSCVVRGGAREGGDAAWRGPAPRVCNGHQLGRVWGRVVCVSSDGATSWACTYIVCRADAAKVTFNLLHLSLVREYTQIEFGMDAAGVDFERVIDDWVLLLYLVGNDFIPHLPNLHIDKVRAQDNMGRQRAMEQVHCLRSKIFQPCPVHSYRLHALYHVKETNRPMDTTRLD
jgi:5'-3' exoribonuclease 1